MPALGHPVPSVVAGSSERADRRDTFDTVHGGRAVPGDGGAGRFRARLRLEAGLRALPGDRPVRGSGRSVLQSGFGESFRGSGGPNIREPAGVQPRACEHVPGLHLIDIIWQLQVIERTK